MNEDIKVSFSETGARTVKRNMDAITASAEKAQSAVDAFKSSLKFGTNARSIGGLTSALNLLKTELAALNNVAGVVRTLRTELATLQNAGTFLKNLVNAMTGLHAASTNLTSFTKTLQQISTHAGTLNLVTSALNKLAAALPILTTFKKELSAVVALTPKVQALAAAIRGLGAIKTDIRNLSNASKQLAKDIEAAAKHAQNAHRHINQMGGVSQNASQGVWRLRHSLSGIAALLVVSKVREWLDAWQSAAGLFKIATDSMAEMTIVQQRIVELARDTRQEFTPMAELYTRLQRMSENLGASQNEMIDFTKGVATALAIQHTSATQARGALMQLGQAMALGRVRAQEYNSINENLPVVLMTVAKNIKGVDGDLGKLRQRMLAGKLSAREFFNAFSKGIPTLAQDFEKTTVTISQAFTVADTNFTAYIGKLDDALGISDKFGKTVIWLTQQLDLLVPAIVAVGIALIGAFGPKGLGMVIAGLRTFGALLLANPTTALVAGLAAIAVYMASAGDKIEIGTGAMIDFEGQCLSVRATVKDVFTVIGQDIGKGMETAGQVFNDITSDILIGMAQISTEAELTSNDIASAFGKDSFGTGWGGFANQIFFAIDLAYAGIVGFATQIVVILETAGNQAGAMFGYALNNAIQSPLEAAGQSIIDAANKLRTLSGKKPLEFKAELPDVYVPPDFEKTLKEKLTGVMDAAFEDMDKNGLLAYSKELQARALEYAKARKLAEMEARNKMNEKGTPSPIIDPNAEKEAERAAKRLKDEFEKLQSAYDPISAAAREMADDLDSIAKARQAELITDKQLEQYSSAIKKHYEDALDPVKAMTTEHEKELANLKMSPDIRKVEEEVTRRVLELRKQMGIQAKIDTDQIREQVRLLQEQERLASAKQQIYGQTVGARQEVVDQRKAVGQMLEDPNSKFGIGDARAFWMKEQPTLFEGTQEQMDAQRVQYEQMYRDIDLMRQQDVISERTAGQMKRKVAAEQLSLQTKNASDFFGNMASLSKSGNSKLAAIGKAAAIAQATIQGWVAVQNALAIQPYPVGVAMAASAAVAAAANVASIVAQPVGFMTGGEFTVGGRGGADSQMVAFRATPGERVQVQTPQQYRKGAPEQSQQQQQQNPMSIRIVNIQDKRLVGDYLSTTEGEKLILNVLEKNPATVRRLTMR